MKKKGIMLGVLGVLAAITGLMMLSAPSAFVATIVVLSGIAAVINGIINLTVTRSLLMDDPIFKLNITIRGISSILIGVLAVSLPLVFAKITWIIMIYVLSVYLICASCMELFAILKLHHAKIPVKQYVLEICVTLLLAILLLMLPAEFGLFIVKVGGVVLLITGAAFTFYSVKYAPVVIEPDSVEDDIPQ